MGKLTTTKNEEVTSTEEVIDENVTPDIYFERIKNLTHKSTKTDLNKIYENCLTLANKYNITGQIRGLRKILYCMECISKEKQLVDMGIDTFVYKDDVDFYIDHVSQENGSPVKIIEVRRYEREIPDDIVDVISTVKDIFDELYVVYTDYTDKTDRQIKEEDRRKDPILFGVFINDTFKVCEDRFYYLGDWVDEYCDLTLDKMIEVAESSGRNIKRTIKTPKDVDELRNYIDANYEIESGSFSNIKQKADKDVKRNLFQKVRSYMKGNKNV